MLLELKLSTVTGCGFLSGERVEQSYLGGGTSFAATVVWFNATASLLLVRTDFGVAVTGLVVSGATSGSAAQVTLVDDSVQDRLSCIIGRRLPEFVREEDPQFIAFVKAYFEAGESGTGVAKLSSHLGTLKDVDSQNTSLLALSCAEFLPRFPQNVLVQKPWLIKMSRDLYRTKGSETSYRFLFRVLYDSLVDFYYPNRDLFRLSDGNWSQAATMRVRIVSGRLSMAVGSKLVGRVSGATAVIRSVQFFNYNGETLAELGLTPQSITGEFEVNENCEATTPDGEQILVVTVPVVASLSIMFAGSGYAVGEYIRVYSPFGTGAITRISEVSQAGAITAVNIVDSGWFYSADGLGCSVQTVNGIGALIIPESGAVVRQAGRYLDDSSFLSSIPKLQDGYYYQQFSYVIKSSQSLRDYAQLIRDIVHPAGLAVYGSILDINVNSSASALWAEGIVAKLTPVRKSTMALMTLDGDYGYTNYRIRWISDASDPVGPVADSLDRQMFRHPPSDSLPGYGSAVSGAVPEDLGAWNSLGSVQHVDAANAEYWAGGFPNTPLAAYEDFLLDDLENGHAMPVSICPEPYLATLPAGE